MLVILDAGHGIETPGKRSPDGKFREYKYCRDIVGKVKVKLERLGYKVVELVTTDSDLSLTKRCQLANKYCKDDKDSIIVSIHNDAMGLGSLWMNALGWSARISLNASSKSKILAECLANAAEFYGLKVRKPSPFQKYWVLNLAICRDTNCPAVLTENLFQDNKEDVNYLLSEKGIDTIVSLHVKGIIDYFNR